MADSIVTNTAKEKMVKARAGILSKLPKISGVAFGNGAVIDSNLRFPLPTDTALQNELWRQEVDGYELLPDGISVLYTCTLAKETLGGEVINEVALYDEEGDLTAIKTFSNKGKDDDMEMVFQLEDTF